MFHFISFFLVTVLTSSPFRNEPLSVISVIRHSTPSFLYMLGILEVNFYGSHIMNRKWTNRSLFFHKTQMPFISDQVYCRFSPVPIVCFSFNKHTRMFKTNVYILQIYQQEKILCNHIIFLCLNVKYSLKNQKYFTFLAI